MLIPVNPQRCYLFFQLLAGPGSRKRWASRRRLKVKLRLRRERGNGEEMSGDGDEGAQSLTRERDQRQCATLWSERILWM